MSLMLWKEGEVFGVRDTRCLTLHFHYFIHPSLYTQGVSRRSCKNFERDSGELALSVTVKATGFSESKSPSSNANKTKGRTVFGARHWVSRFKLRPRTPNKYEAQGGGWTHFLPRLNSSLATNMLCAHAW